MSQHPNDAIWRLARLHSLTNFGYLTVNSPVLDVALDSWYFLPLSIGRMVLRQPISIWLDAEVAQDLNGVIARTVAAFRGFAHLRTCALGYSASPSSIQGWSASIPIQEERSGADVALYMEQQRLKGQMVSVLFLDFDVRVTCRSSRTHAVGDFWLPGLHITLTPDRHAPTAPSAEPSAQPPHADTGVTWTAECSSACATLFRRDNDLELARARAYWRALQVEEPEIEVAPGEDDDYQMLITEVQPSSVGGTNTHLWSVNLPRLKAAISQWERAMSSAFEWKLDTGA